MTALRAFASLVIFAAIVYAAAWWQVRVEREAERRERRRRMRRRP